MKLLAVPSALSNFVLSLFIFPGFLAVLITIPRSDQSVLASPQWWYTAVLSQVAFTLAVILTRRFVHSISAFIIVVIFAGTLRGSIIVASMQFFDLESRGTPITRVASSILVSVFWIGLISLVVRWFKSFAVEYQQLLETEVNTSKSTKNSEVIDENALNSWLELRNSLSELNSETKNILVADTATEMQRAAAVIRESIDSRFRPASHELLAVAVPAAPRLTLRNILRLTFDPWHPPVVRTWIPAIVVVAVGSIVRTGWDVGATYTTLYAITLILCLAASIALSKKIRGTTLVITPLLCVLTAMPLALAWVVGDLIFSTPPDYAGAAIISIQTPVTVIGIALINRLDRERKQALDLLRTHIDMGVIEELASRMLGANQVSELGVFLHNSLQSELLALSILLSDAAKSADPEVMNKTKGIVLSRLAIAQESNTKTSPWSCLTKGAPNFMDICQAWEGIATIRIELPQRSIDPRRAATLYRIIEEGVANAIRHGNADVITVVAEFHTDGLRVTISDNGRGHQELRTQTPQSTGAGSRWFTQISHSTWTREHDEEGTILRINLA